MLQIIIKTDSEKDFMKQAKIAFEGGCKWIELNLSSMDETSAEKIIKDLKPLCKKNECILTVRDNITLAINSLIEGVFLSDTSVDALSIREQMGQQYIIGVEAKTFDDVKRLARQDIDYIALNSVDLTFYTSIMEQCRGTELEIPIVAITDSSIDVNSLMNTGINGVAMSVTNLDATSVSQMVSQLSAISENRNQN